jgi:hypothetical protein
MEDATTIPLVSRRRERGQLLQKIQHALPSFVLLMNGIQGLQAGHEGFARVLALAELVTSGLVIGGIARSVRRMRRAHDERAAAHHSGIDWIDLFLAAMLATEAFSHQHRTGHLPRPTILLSVLMLALGLLHGRIADRQARRRSLRADDRGISIGGRFFTRFTATWPDIARIDIGDRYATIATRDGRTKKIDLDDLRNRADIVAALQRASKNLRTRTLEP